MTSLVSPTGVGLRGSVRIEVIDLGATGWRASATVHGAEAGFAEPMTGSAAPPAQPTKAAALNRAADAIRNRLPQRQLSPQVWTWLEALSPPRGAQPDMFGGAR